MTWGQADYSGGSGVVAERLASGLTRTLFTYVKSSIRGNGLTLVRKKASKTTEHDRRRTVHDTSFFIALESVCCIFFSFG